MINFRSDEISLRDLIQQCKDQGFENAHHVSEGEKSDIRAILAHEVTLYRNRFLGALLLWIPIMVLAWIVPYTNPEFLTAHVLVNGNTVYVLLMLVFSTII